MPAVAVEVAQACQVPVEAVGHAAHRAAARARQAAVHGVVVPAAVFVAEEDVVAVVAVEVGDAGHGPFGALGEVGLHGDVGRDGEAVERGVEPLAVGMAEHHVGLAVTAQVAEAGDVPDRIGGEASD